jgi:hypothetical protein
VAVGLGPTNPYRFETAPINGSHSPRLPRNPRSQAVCQLIRSGRPFLHPDCGAGAFIVCGFTGVQPFGPAARGCFIPPPLRPSLSNFMTYALRESGNGVDLSREDVLVAAPIGNLIDDV